MLNYKIPNNLKKNKGQKTKTLAFRVNEELASTVETIAEKNNMQKSEILEIAIELLLNKLE